MATKKKMLQAAAGQAGGEALDITDVFSTYLYEGNGSTQTITNDIDLAGEGGLVWIKNRENISGPHYLHDSEMSSDIQYLSSNSNGGLQSGAAITKNSNGFSIASTSWEGLNASGEDYASWTFRKAPKFFDVVTFTASSSSGTVNHSLEVEPHVVVIKRTDASEDWLVSHASVGGIIYLNLPDARTTFNLVPSRTSTTFGYNGLTSGGTYVAYLFAHNNGDGDFGPDGDQDIIKCGSYTGNGSIDGPEINLGFEPQWFMWKRTDATANWHMADNMRGISTGDPGDPGLFANLQNAENPDNSFNLTATGLKCQTNNSEINASGGNYIYMAIRRGPLAQPESGTEVFAPTLGNAVSSTPTYNGGFVADFAISGESARASAGGHYTASRLTGNAFMLPHNTQAEATASSLKWDYMNGAHSDAGWTGRIGWLFRRAPGFFDVVAYTGDGTNDRALKHNLGVEPEFIISKRRDGVEDWGFWVNSELWYGSPETDYPVAKLNTADGTFYSGIGKTNNWDASQIIIESGAANPFATNVSGHNYVMYMFATLSGISKCGLYTGNGTSQTIDCGFTSGARFVLIKRTDALGSWFVWDAERGIVSGNEPYLTLNQTAPEDSGSDTVDPNSSGFIVNETNYLNQNTSGGSYIFYAIA